MVPIPSRPHGRSEGTGRDPVYDFIMGCAQIFFFFSIKAPTLVIHRVRGSGLAARSLCYH